MVISPHVLPSGGGAALGDYVRRDTAIVDGTLDVAGVTTLADDAAVGGDLAVTGAATVGGTLGVTGAVTSGAIAATGANLLDAPGASPQNSALTNRARSPQGTLSLVVGSGADTTGFTADQIDGVIRFTGSGTAYADVVHCPAGGANGQMGQLRFVASSGAVDATPDMVVGVGAIYVHRNDALRGIRFGADVNLYRSAADTLRTDDALSVGGALTIAGNVGFYGGAATAKQAVSGSRGGNAALASLLTSLAAIGLITDSTTA